MGSRTDICHRKFRFKEENMAVTYMILVLGAVTGFGYMSRCEGHDGRML